MTPIQLNNLQRQYESLELKINAVSLKVLRSGWYIHGTEVKEFESEFCDYVGRQHCVGVANGTDALELALRSVGVQAGDEVITVSNAGMYTTTACAQIGAQPVYVDTDAKTMVISATSVGNAMSDRVKAVVVTHLYGYVADVEQIRNSIGTHSVPIIEDCAQAHGALLRGRQAGSFGDTATFSFYPTKNLGAYGDGGAVLTDDYSVSERLRKLRQYGWEAKYHTDLPFGKNSRLDEIQAAILRIKLPSLNTWNAERRRIYTLYREAASGTDLKFSHEADDRFVAHLCVVRCLNRDDARKWFNDKSISTEIHYPVLDFQQPTMKVLPHRISSFQNSEQATKEIFTLPCHPNMTDQEIDCVVDAIQTSP
jgi:dTDP-4-amino-4,6-dideoxygalactose transaminase